MKKIIFFLVLMFVAIQFVEANRYHSHCSHRSVTSNQISKKIATMADMLRLIDQKRNILVRL